MSEKLAIVEQLVKRGFHVFPLAPNVKTPEGGISWKRRSTVDLAAVRKWFTDPVLGWDCDVNIGIDCGKSGVLVIDVDVKNGKRGEESFNELDLDHGFPPTLEFKTASGGRHVVYRNVDKLRCTTGRYGDGIDTRGIGGYIVAPSSDVDGKEYTILHDRPIVDAPHWLYELLPSYVHNTDDEKGECYSEDHPDDIDRAIAFLEREADEAVEGDGGDATTFKVLARVKDFGIAEDTALELALEHWNHRCAPPWDAEDLARKVYNAYHYGHNPVGVSSPQADFGDAYNNVSPKTADDKRPRVLEAKPFDLDFDIDDIPHRDWVFDNIALAKKVTVGVAPPGAGKSTLMIEVAISKASGRRILNMDPHEVGNVWMFNNEDDYEEIKRRTGAVLRKFGVSSDELRDENGESRIFMNSGEDRALRIAERNKGGAIVPKDAQRVIDIIREKKIRLMIVDPFIETHPAKENDNNETALVGKIYRDIAQKANCALILIHHTKKLDMASSDGHEGNLDTVRGASSLGGVARIVFTFFTMSEKMAKRMGVADKERKRYVGLSMAKANMSAVGDDVRWFERVGERIGVKDVDDVGEDVGVLVPAKLESVNGDRSLTLAERELVQDIEAMTEDGLMPLRDVVAEMISALPAHQMKKKTTLERAIRRFFEEGTKVHIGATGNTVALDFVRSDKNRGPRVIAAIRVTPNADQLKAESDLL